MITKIIANLVFEEKWVDPFPANEKFIVVPLKKFYFSQHIPAHDNY